MEAESAPAAAAAAVAPKPTGPPARPKWAPRNSQSTLKFGAIVKKEPEIVGEPAAVKVEAEEPKASKKGKDESPKKPKKEGSPKKEKKKKHSKGSDSDGEKKKKKKKQKKEEDDDPERALKKERKRKIKEAIKEKKRKDRKRKRSEFISDESKKPKKRDKNKASDDEKEVNTSDEEPDPELAEFTSTHPSDEEESLSEGSTTESDSESGSDGEKEERRQSKRLSHDSAKDIKHGDGEGEVAEAMEVERQIKEAAEAVGSRATKNAKKDKKKDKAEKPKKRKVCGYCDKDIPENWKQDRGENTGTGKVWVYFHEQCFEPFLAASKKLRAEGKKPNTAKGKKKEEKPKEKPKEEKKEKKPKEEEKGKEEKKPKEEKKEKKPKEEKRGAGGEPAAKKAKPAPSMPEMIDALAKARENFDRFVNYVTDRAATTISVDQLALDIETFLGQWKVSDDGMQEIEDGKSGARAVPEWNFDREYSKDFIFFYLMNDERGFKRFQSAIKKRLAAPAKA